MEVNLKAQNKQQFENFKIGHNEKSETSTLNLFEYNQGCDNEPIYFCDTPGFEDTKGTEISISNTFGLK